MSMYKRCNQFMLLSRFCLPPHVYMFQMKQAHENVRCLCRALSLSQKKPSFFPVSIYKLATIGPPAKRRSIFKLRFVGRPIVARDYTMYMLAQFSFYLVDCPVYFSRFVLTIMHV